MARVRLRVGERVSPWETALRQGVLVGPDGVEHAVLVRRLGPPAEAGALRAAARSVLDEGIPGLALPLNVSPVEGGGVTVSCPAVAGATLGAVRRWAGETGSRVPAGVARAIAQAVESLVVALEARGLGPDAPVEDGVLWRADGRLLALGPAAAPAGRWDGGDWAMAVGGPAVRYAAAAPGEMAAAAGAVFAAMRARTGLGPPPGEEPLELGSVVAPAPPAPAAAPPGASAGVGAAWAPAPDPTDPSLFEAQAEEAIPAPYRPAAPAPEGAAPAVAPVVPRPPGPPSAASPPREPGAGVDLGRVAVAVSLVGAAVLVLVVVGARWPAGPSSTGTTALPPAPSAAPAAPRVESVAGASVPAAALPAPAPGGGVAAPAPARPVPALRPGASERAPPPPPAPARSEATAAAPPPAAPPSAARGPWTVSFSADAPVDSLLVRCHGGVEGTGAGRVVLSLPAAGPCRVRAVHDGAALEARVSVDGPQDFTCFSQGLSRCR